MQLIKLLEKIRSFSPSLVYRILQLRNNKLRTNEEFMEAYWQLVGEDRMLLSVREAYNIYYYLIQSIPLGGAIAELGVYRGGGAKLIGEFKSDLPLHLFDTFSGMPAVNNDIDHHHEGDFSDTTLENVRHYLSGYSDCYFHQGLFPYTTHDLAVDTEFCFVHLDVDIYESTLSGLRYFFPRLKKGGMLISHDYNAISCPGVRRAFDEYFKDSDQEIRYLWDTQCAVKKTD